MKKEYSLIIQDDVKDFVIEFFDTFEDAVRYAQIEIEFLSGYDRPPADLAFEARPEDFESCRSFTIYEHLLNSEGEDTDQDGGVVVFYDEIFYYPE